MNNTPSIENIDTYISTFPKATQQLMQKVRKAIRKAAPNATECINYQMPTFKLNGKNLVHFAAYEHHIGFYPTPNAITAFADKISGYKNAIGSVQFPINEPMPLELIGSMTAFRVKQEEAKFVKPATAKPFMNGLSAPAQRALANEGIKTLKQLSKYSEKELLKLHGFGKASLPVLRKLLEAEGLMFEK